MIKKYISKNQGTVPLHIDSERDHAEIQKIAHALSNIERIRIMQAIIRYPKTQNELAKELNIPFSSLSRHIIVLEDADLIYIDLKPATKGHVKYCTRITKNFSFFFDPLSYAAAKKKETYSMEMPVGLFCDHNINRPCGISTGEKHLILYDIPETFFSPSRVYAECLWFKSGFISYKFPVDWLQNHICNEILFSFECCSETIFYNNDWPSDITVFINDIEIITFTSPGDFGGERGKYSPPSSPIDTTQFGILKKIGVTHKGVFLDNTLVDTSVTIDDLHLADGSFIKFTIGVKEDAEHCGGINLFGKNFGNYPQAIVMTLSE